MKKRVSLFLALIMLISSIPAFPTVLAADEETIISYVTDSGENLTFEAAGDEMFSGYGKFDSSESLNHFTTGGYLVEGDTETKLSQASSYWRYNSNGYLEALGNGGSTTKSSMLTFLPLNGGEEIGEEKMYYFSMRVYTSSAQSLKLAWNMTRSKQFWSINSGTLYGGRYPDYGSASLTLDNPNAIDNNTPTYVPGGWHTIESIIVADESARYFMLNLRYLQGTSSSPTRFDDIVLYEVTPHNAASEIFLDGYVVYDSLPAIDGVWSDSEGFIKNGVYTQPEFGAIDTITANYTDGTSESFTVEVVGKKAVNADGGIYHVVGENLIRNASFEHFETDNRSDGATYPFFPVWESTITGSNEAGINDATNGCFAINQERFVTGKTSMRVRYNDGYDNHSSFNQHVTLSEGSYYLSFYTRRTTSDKRDLEVRLNGDTIHSFNNVTIEPDWKKFSCVFDANEGDEFEFTGYKVESVYVDSFLLVAVEKTPTAATVNILDTNNNTLYSEAVTDLAVGAVYEYDYPLFEEFADGLYVYKEGSNKIDALSATDSKNAITLIYEKADNVDSSPVLVETPHHVAPEMPDEVQLRINGRIITASAVWDDIDENLYASEGKFTLHGTAGNYIPLTATVTVTENINYLEGRLSTDNFTTVKDTVAVGDMCEITFDVLPLANNIDGTIGFTADNVTVDEWNSCGIAIRMYTSGRFQYYDDSEGYVNSNAFYKANIAYTVRILVNFENDTYSAYLYQKGAYYGTIICENAAFRSNAEQMNNIGQYLARGGSSAPAGEFIIGNMAWGKATPVSFIRAFKGEDGQKNVILQANETGESKLYYTDYTDGYFGDMHTEVITYTKGERFTLLLEEADNHKLIMVDDMLVPEFVAKDFDANHDPSFSSSFMGSFAFYANDYNPDIVDDDPGIVQANILEIYSDRITITTRNFGQYNGGAENPAPSVFKRYNGDDSQTDVPTMRVLLISDYQIGDYLLTDEEDYIRPVFRKMCEELSDEHFDAIMIGGDMTFASSVTKERWEMVVGGVFDLLKENISPNIYTIAGNHDYHTGERDNYNSADYYNMYMKENLGSLEDNGNGYFEQSSYYEGDVLVAFCYEQDGIYFMGLSTSPDMMRGNLQNTNYNYTEGAMDWVENKLAEIGPDKTVLFTAHFPLGDSNNIVRSSKGAAPESTNRLTDILKDYPNLLHLYGHDHGSSFAFISEKTEERVTRYDTEGYKMN